MSFLIQHIEGLVLIACGLVILVGFLQQFGVVQGRGLLGLIAGVAALFGWSIFQNARKRRIREEIEAKRAELDQQEEELEEFRTRYELSVQQLQAQKQTLADERRMYLKRLAEIEANSDEELRRRLTEIENTPPDELADQLTRFARGEDSP